MAKPSERISNDIDTLVDFRQAYISLVNATKAVQEDWEPKLRPKVGQAEWADLQQRVARASGAAAMAYARGGGGTFTLQNAAYLMRNVDPVANWAMSLENPEQMSPERVIAAVDGAIGAATTNYSEAKRHEKGIVGLVAAFLRWPEELRSAAGMSSAQRTAAGALGVIGQILVGVVAAAVGAWVVMGVAQLWEMAFPAQ